MPLKARSGHQAAFTQAGYPSPQNAPGLRKNELVAKRIDELQVRDEGKAEVAALKRIIIEQLRAGYADSCAHPRMEESMLFAPVHQSPRGCHEL
jgi:hypothetical protein